ncbi:MAG TPA: flagellar hook assembly protein FlgD [Mizugakiibacter sp.]|nr:flagellar hook assembly protein FlgD [Mizugakiibacter sp.]
MSFASALLQRPITAPTTALAPAPAPAQMGTTRTTGTGQTTGGHATAAPTLNENDFLTLLVSQLKNQDPTKPMSSTQFVAQLAQFSTVSGIQQMQASMASLASSLSGNQSLQAASLIGHAVLAPSASAALAEGRMQGAVNVPNGASDVRVAILDANGTLVRSIDLGAQPAGLVRFQWNGQATHGSTMPDGNYTIRAQAVSGSQAKGVVTLAQGLVQSVVLGVNGTTPTLKVQGLGSIPLSSVRQIL